MLKNTLPYTAGTERHTRDARSGEWSEVTGSCWARRASARNDDSRRRAMMVTRRARSDICGHISVRGFASTANRRREEWGMQRFHGSGGGVTEREGEGRDRWRFGSWRTSVEENENVGRDW